MKTKKTKKKYGFANRFEKLSKDYILEEKERLVDRICNRIKTECNNCRSEGIDEECNCCFFSDLWYFIKDVESKS